MNIPPLEYTVGALVVALYSIDRITTPSIKPETTTPQRYWCMVLAYAAATVLLYVSLSLSIGAGGIEILKKLELIPQSADASSPPVLVALLLTVLLPKIPGLARLDEGVRREFRRRASMSSIAGNLSYLLQRSPLTLTPEREAAVTAYLRAQGICKKDIVFVNNASVQYTWTRIEVLLASLREWRAAPEFRNFVAAFRDEWEELIEDSEKCEAKAVRCFRLGRVVGNGAPARDALLSSALTDCRRHYAEQLAALLQRLSDFMGRGIAAACGNDPERRRLALVEIGLDVRSDVGYTAHQIAFVMMVALGGTVLFPLLIQLLGHGEYRINQYVFKVAAGYTIAALVALSHHRRRDHLPRADAGRPWGEYLMVGVWAAALTVLFALAFDLVTRRDPLATFARLWQGGIVYQLRPLVFGMVMAYLVDTPVARARLRVRQWTETAIVAAAMALTSLAIWLILDGLITAHPEWTSPPRLPDVATMTLSAAALGAILGYWLPTSTRRVAERVHDAGELRAARPAVRTVVS